MHKQKDQHYYANSIREFITICALFGLMTLILVSKIENISIDLGLNNSLIFACDSKELNLLIFKIRKAIII